MDSQITDDAEVMEACEIAKQVDDLEQLWEHCGPWVNPFDLDRGGRLIQRAFIKMLGDKRLGGRVCGGVREVIPIVHPVSEDS